MVRDHTKQNSEGEPEVKFLRVANFEDGVRKLSYKIGYGDLNSRIVGDGGCKSSAFSSLSVVWFILSWHRVLSCIRKCGPCAKRGCGASSPLNRESPPRAHPIRMHARRRIPSAA